MKLRPGIATEFSLFIPLVSAILWLGSILPHIKEVQEFNYLTSGIISAALFGGAAFGFLGLKKPDYSKIISVTLCLIYLSVTTIRYFVEHIVLDFIALFSLGMIIAFYLTAVFSADNKVKNKTFLYALMGIALATWVCFLDLGHNISHIVLIAFAVILTIDLILKKANYFSAVDFPALKFQDFKNPLILMAGLCLPLAMALEAQFVVWHLIVPVIDTEIQVSYLLPAIMSLLFVYRIFTFWVSKYLQSPVWLFCFSVITTILLGMIYTLHVLSFIVLFPLFLAFVFSQIKRLSGLGNRVIPLIYFTFIIIAALLIWQGWLIDRFLEKIIELKLPKNVISLSLLQSIVKDIVVLPALLTIISGILFIFRRKFKFESTI